MDDTTEALKDLAAPIKVACWVINTEREVEKAREGEPNRFLA